MHIYVLDHAVVHVGVRGQLCGIGSLFQLCMGSGDHMGSPELLFAESFTDPMKENLFLYKGEYAYLAR